MIYLAWALTAVSLATVVAWAWLVLLRGTFWRTDVRLPAPGDTDGDGDGDGQMWPSVAVLVPARNEAGTLPETLPTLLAQEYPGDLAVLLVDDGSDDGTGRVARTIGAVEPGGDRLTVLSGTTLPPGWTGKLWALQTAVEAVGNPAPDFFLLTDADISHPPDSVSRLVAKARETEADLVSLMARLRLTSLLDRLLLPAFVFFFAKLYPFRWSNDPRHRIAAAAGGCVLVRRSALERAGGLASISGAVIDDCSLAAAIKGSGGRTWLGFSEDVLSVRVYGAISPVWSMVARTAYTQLGFSPAALAGTVAGMLLLYLAPPVAVWGAVALAAVGKAPEAAIVLGAGGAAAWALMAGSFVPTLRLYKAAPVVAPALPVAGALFTVFTVASAWRHWSGRAGTWRGRALPTG